MIFDRMQLSDAEKYLLCDYPMVIDYILEINLTKRQKIKNGSIHFKWSYLIKIGVGQIKSKDYLL